LKKNFFDDKTIVERYFETLNKLDITNDTQGLEVWLPEENNTTYTPEKKDNHLEQKYFIKENNFTTPNKLIISIAPSAKHNTKQ
jgi:hypothetical protein